MKFPLRCFIAMSYPSAESSLLACFLRYQNDLLLFLAGKVNCVDTAADLVQETYLRIVRYPEADQVINHQAFIYRIADNLALDHLRARARRDRRDTVVADDDLVCRNPEPYTVLSDQQQLEMLEKLIYELPPACRTVFLLCRVEGKSYAQIADELDISPRTVESHMHKALKTLKQRFDGQ